MKKNPQVSSLTYIRKHPLPQVYWCVNNFRTEDGRRFFAGRNSMLALDNSIVTPATSES